MHIPSCAGTSFKNILSDIYNKELQVCYLDVSRPSDIKKLNIMKNTKIIHGHFLSNVFDNIYTEKKIITWIRKPVERIISRYYYFKRIPDHNNSCSNVLNKNKLNICEFAELEEMRDNMIQYFSNKNVNDFDFIGVVENWDKSIEKVSKILNWTLKTNNYKENKNPENIDNISKKEYDYIESLNTGDTKLYKNIYNGI